MSEPSARWLLCECGGQRYALAADALMRLVGNENLQRSPAASGPIGWLLGESEELEVYSLQATLEGRRPHAPGSHGGRALVLADGDQRWALWVDRIHQVIEVEHERLQKLPDLIGRSAQQLFSGALVVDDEVLLCITPSALRRQVLEEPVPARALGFDTATADHPPQIRTSPKRAHGRAILFSTSGSRNHLRRMLFGLSITQVVEVSSPVPWVPVPRAVPGALGTCNWHGRAVVILDLDTCLGWQVGARRSDERVLIVRLAQGDLIGIPTYSDLRGVALNIPHHLGDTPLEIDPALLRATFELDEATLLIPDLAAITAAMASSTGNVDGSS